MLFHIFIVLAVRAFTFLITVFSNGWSLCKSQNTPLLKIHSLYFIICLFTFANNMLLKLKSDFCHPVKEEFESKFLIIHTVVIHKQINLA